MDIVNKIGLPAALEQSAEECIELAHVCLKLARKLRGENPTPRTEESLRKDLQEEMADVHLCTDLVKRHIWPHKEPGKRPEIDRVIAHIVMAKHDRWIKRILKAEKEKEG